MDSIQSFGTELAIAALSLLFILVLLFNWRSVTSFLYDSGIAKIHASDRTTEFTLRLKVMLLKISGASHHDIENQQIDYLGASQLEQTYFAKNKFRCFWQLFSYYMLYCLVMVILARPIDIPSSIEVGRLVAFDQIRDASQMVLNVGILALSNVLTDLLSLAITYVHLSKISVCLNQRQSARAAYYAIRDVVCAGALFIVSQVVSNFLYPRAVINPPSDYDPLTVEAALMPYAFMQSVTDGMLNFYPFVFPGQLFITGTVFVPTLLTMALILLVVVLLLILKIVGRLQFYFLRDDALLDLMAPAALPEVGDALQSRTKRCIQFSVNSIYTIILGAMGSLLFYVMSKMFGLP
ncbi:hypothetical protein [Cognatiyoonia sp. IB215182]|uniref:hypothetical protein n=1 Tax=Cognatiyoonia sp. IB215182 TaxID=3097353 RepID=UPI002A12C562|nr:hypothetical protein [Cognatiyoonia sp. IB215182]MDX8355857.1 hypothetical protein [Cognatiyoonia sp. IB215182]